jgi:hypothetical protein
MKKYNLKNKKFGRWTVLGLSKSTGHEKFWLCRCECGIEKEVRTSPLVRGRSLSCGCLSREISRKMRLKHGFKGTPEYKTWDSIKQRCYNKKHKSYNLYGGRGIKMCNEWLHSFENFIRDLGVRPTLKHSIDRIDNSLGYFKENCRWATRREQALNRRSNVFLTIFGERKTISEWILDFRCKATSTAFPKRLELGWSPEKALLHPMKMNKQKT